MAIRLSSVPLGLAILATASGLAGCDAIRVALESDAPLPVKNEAGLLKLGKELGDVLTKGNYAAAYALCSAQLKGRQTEEQFTTDVKNEWHLQSEGARPVKFELEPWMPAEDEFEEWEGMPKDIKYSQLLGVVQMRFALEVEDDEVVRSFHAAAIVVDEGGQPKVAYIEIYEAD
ncbi:MAG: hypothetical protein L0211_03450 [Planctomycetaceae bacterium]|nr:hypothetical protein [Planctomycetaceae bacterium]